METTRPAAANEVHSQVNFDEIVADFELLEDWEDRYRYVIELGRKLQPLPEAERNDINKVQGCVSQVWLATTVKPDSRAPRLIFIGDSDAHIVRGLIAILFALTPANPPMPFSISTPMPCSAGCISKST